jgi:serine/threonine protein kinase
MSEKDIVINTIPDSKLRIFIPPSSIICTPRNFPIKPSFSYTRNSSNNLPRASFSYLSKLEYLGSGGFSKVYKFSGDINNKAVKKIIADPKYYSKNLTAVDSIKREVYGMKTINCEHSVKVYDVYQNASKNIFYIIMEQCDGNIENYIKERGYPLNINEVTILLNQLNEVFNLLDIHNIIHRDIKPSNILYKEDKENRYQQINMNVFEGRNFTFKLGDYGVCIPLHNSTYSKSQFMGTLDFMAPEIYKMKTEKEHPIYTKKIDIFSLGQSILCLMGYIEKARALTENKINELRAKCNLFRGNMKEKLLADLIFNNLLIIDPDERVDWKQYFQHPFFTNQYDTMNSFEEDKLLEEKLKINKMENFKERIPILNHSLIPTNRYSYINIHDDNNDNNNIINMKSNLYKVQIKINNNYYKNKNKFPLVFRNNIQNHNSNDRYITYKDLNFEPNNTPVECKCNKKYRNKIYLHYPKRTESKFADLTRKNDSFVQNQSPVNFIKSENEYNQSTNNVIKETKYKNIIRNKCPIYFYKAKNFETTNNNNNNFKYSFDVRIINSKITNNYDKRKSNVAFYASKYSKGEHRLKTLIET